MIKKFDCIEMKRKAARKINQKLLKLSLEEELNYWQDRSTELKELKLNTRKKHKEKV